MPYEKRNPGFSVRGEGLGAWPELLSELWLALNPICEHYGWQGVSDGSRLPLSRVREGEAIPPIEERLLAAVEKPARRLLETEKEAREARTMVGAEVKPARKKANPNDPRDKFIYEALRKGRQLTEIRKQISEHQEWEAISTPQGISEAAKRYAGRKGKKWPLILQ